MKKLISIVILITFVCGVLSGCKNNEDTDILLSSGRPDGEALSGIGIPEESDLEGHIALAYWLYDNANKLDQQCEKRIATSYCPVKTTMKVLGVPIDVQVDAYVYDIKNGEEYFKADYQVAMQGLGALASRFKKDMVYGEVSYCTLDMEERIIHKVLNATIVDGRPVSDWTDAEVRTAPIPYFHTSQELLYEKTDIVIRPETIISANVTYDPIGRYYSVAMELDVENELTTSKTLANLRSGAGDDAVYTSIIEAIEIWDNGYYKDFLSTDKWTSGSLSAELPYRTAYSYRDEDCDINSYEEALQIIGSLQQ